VFDTAESLLLGGQTPTVMGVCTRLGGGSPNIITRLVGSSESGKRLLERLESQETPNRAMRELFGEDPVPEYNDSV
jgi:hypothetical protein